MQPVIALWVMSALACGQKAPKAQEATTPPAKAAEPVAPDEQVLQNDEAPIPPDGYRYERIALPPEFAPDLGYGGVEELLFRDGMFKPEAEDFFSYGFVLRLTGDDELTRERLQELLVVYYRGLGAAVAKGRKIEWSDDVQVTVSQARERSDAYPHFVAQVKWQEPFVTGKAQDLRIAMWTSAPGQPKCVVALASPQSQDHAVWQQLEQLRSWFRCQD